MYSSFNFTLAHNADEAISQESLETISDELLDNADANKDGYIDFSEFKEYRKATRS